MTNYREIAQDIMLRVGGPENINNINHCATRLRLTLADAGRVDERELKAVRGVMGIVARNNNLQIIVGTEVPGIYAEFVKLNEGEGVKADTKQSDSVGEKTEGKKDAKHYFGRFVDFIGGVFVPVLPVLIAGGLIGAILTVCTSFFGLGTESGTYVILSAVNNAAFYFLPVFVGYNVAKKLDIPAILGAYLGAVLLHSSINGIAGLHFLGIPMTTVSYGSSVLPIIFGVLFMSVVYKFFDKIIPKEIKYFVVPLLTMLIVTPITLTALGPVGTWCGNILAAGLQWVNIKLGWLSVGLMGAISPLLYMTGMNQALFPLCFAEFDAFGYDPFVLPGMLAANVSVGTAALTVWFKSKGADNKAIALSTGLTGVLGITEPAVFGVLLPLKRPLIASMIGGGAGGIFAGIVHLAEYSIVSPGLAGLIAFIPNDGTMKNFYMAIVTVIISVITTVIATLALGFKEKTE